MTTETEIRIVDPIPDVEYEQHGDHDTVDLHCSICDVRFHAEGDALGPMVEIVDEWHRQRHQHQREGGEA